MSSRLYGEWAVGYMVAHVIIVSPPPQLDFWFQDFFRIRSGIGSKETGLTKVEQTTYMEIKNYYREYLAPIGWSLELQPIGAQYSW